jgi:PKD repeat protein
MRGMIKSAFTPALAMFVLLFAIFALPSANSQSTQGRIIVSAIRESSELSIGSLQFGKAIRTQRLSLPAWVNEVDEIRFGLRAVGGGASHIDAFSIEGFEVTSVINQTTSTLYSAFSEHARTPKQKMESADFDVLDLSDGLILTLSRTPTVATTTKSTAVPATMPSTAVLEIGARIEPVTISKAVFQFPEINTYRGSDRKRFTYTYFPGVNPGRLAIDGELYGETLLEPFFVASVPVGSGHPFGPVYGWVMDDGESLFVAIDFTSDNTMDGNVDYAAVLVETPDGMKRYRASLDEATWGRPGFTYTDRVPYQHKVYEFQIPFTEFRQSDVDSATSGEPLHLSFETYGTASPSGLSDPDLVYNTLANEFLVAYQSADGGVDSPIDVITERRDHSGALVGSAISIHTAVDTISGFSVPDVSVAVAHNWVENVFLVVWANSGAVIEGQILNAEGAKNGSVISIADTSGGRFDPDVAYDPESGNFVVVWTDTRNANEEIWSQLVEADGNLSGNNFAIADAPANNSAYPAVAVDAENHRVLVVFLDDRNGANEVWGQFLSGDGTLIGISSDNFQILSRAAEFREQFPPSLVFNSIAGEYMLGVDDGVTDTVMGRIIGWDGTLYDHATDDPDVVVDESDHILVNMNGEYTSLDYNPTTDTYLFAWDLYIDGTQDEDIQINTVDGTTLAPGTTADVVTTVELDLAPSVAANPFGGNFLIAYYTLEYNTESRSIGFYSHLNYAPNPGLTWVSGASGVTDITGEAYTFEIDYISDNNTAPTKTELQIDFNGDGEYTAADTTGAFVPPFSNRYTGTDSPVLPARSFGATISLAVSFISKQMTLAGSLLIAASLAMAYVLRRFFRRRNTLLRTTSFSAMRIVSIFITTSLLATTCGYWDGVGTITGSYAAPNVAPTVVISADVIAGSPPLTVNFSADAEDSDGNIESYAWDFGDDGTSSLANPVHVYESEGTYTSSVTVTDDDGATAVGSIDVIVASVVVPEIITMMASDSGDTDYTDGKRYTAVVTIPASALPLKYRFVFSDGIRQAYGYGATERVLE